MTDKTETAAKLEAALENAWWESYQSGLIEGYRRGYDDAVNAMREKAKQEYSGKIPLHNLPAVIDGVTSQ